MKYPIALLAVMASFFYAASAVVDSREQLLALLLLKATCFLLLAFAASSFLPKMHCFQGAIKKMKRHVILDSFRTTTTEQSPLLLPVVHPIPPIRSPPSSRWMIHHNLHAASRSSMDVLYDSNDDSNNIGLHLSNESTPTPTTGKGTFTCLHPSTMNRRVLFPLLTSNQLEEDIATAVTFTSQTALKLERQDTPRISNVDKSHLHDSELEITIEKEDQEDDIPFSDGTNIDGGKLSSHCSSSTTANTDQLADPISILSMESSHAEEHNVADQELLNWSMSAILDASVTMEEEHSAGGCAITSCSERAYDADSDTSHSISECFTPY